jgi:hypothetical protein
VKFAEPWQENQVPIFRWVLHDTGIVKHCFALEDSPETAPLPLGGRLRYRRLTPTRPPLSERKTLLIFRYLRVLSAASIYRDASDLIHYINRDLLSLTDR